MQITLLKQKLQSENYDSAKIQSLIECEQRPIVIGALLGANKNGEIKFKILVKKFGVLLCNFTTIID